MKRIYYLLLIVLLAALNSTATVITVDNNTNSAADFTNLQTAITSANPGDTVYVSGSNTNYGTIIINRRITLIGTGYNPLKQIPLVSLITYITLDTVNSVSGASGTRIMGFTINGYINDVYGAKGVEIRRNYLTTEYLHASSSGYVIENNIFTSSISIANATNVLIQNNLFYGASIGTSNQMSVLINHNVFMNPVGSGHYNMSSISFATIINNIFWGTSPLGGSMSNNTFNNNATYQTPNDVIPGGGNSGTGNLVATNPQFVSAATPAINFSYDYNVGGASPANNAGTDGTDLGIFGGGSPMPDLSGMPGIPQMIEMNILNPAIAPATNLNVTFKAKKNN